jgi:hypothetical protein
LAKLARHHLINGSVALVVALVVSIASWMVVEGNVESIAAGASRTACFEAKTGHVYLRTICKKTETKLVINSAGANGTQGLQGQSAFDLAVANGFTGDVASWLASLVGPQGAPGPQGPSGSNGSDGARGATGATGPQGPIGATGPAGANGTNGTNGTNGFVPAYGYFIDRSTQTMSAVDAPNVMKLGTVLIGDKGVTVANGSRITFAQPGVYNVSFSAQIYKASSSQPEDLDIWLSQNGTNVADSNTQITVINQVSKTGKAVAAWNFLVKTSAANEYCELMWSSSSALISLPYVAPQTLPARPGIPSLIVSVSQVG